MFTTFSTINDDLNADHDASTDHKFEAVVHGAGRVRDGAIAE